MAEEGRVVVPDIPGHDDQPSFKFTGLRCNPLDDRVPRLAKTATQVVLELPKRFSEMPVRRMDKLIHSLAQFEFVSDEVVHTVFTRSPNSGTACHPWSGYAATKFRTAILFQFVCACQRSYGICCCSQLSGLPLSSLNSGTALPP